MKLITAYEAQGGTKDNWWLRAFAVCAWSGIPGYEIVAITSPAGSQAVSGNVNCPAGKSYPICAFYLPGLGNFDTVTWPDSADKAIVSTCVQKIPVSVGWALESRNPGEVTVPTALLTVTGNQVVAQEIGSAVTGTWSLRSRTFCALA